MIQHAPAPFKRRSFGPQALRQTLVESSPAQGSGYWMVEFERLAHKDHIWYLGISAHQKVCYAGTTPYSCTSLLKIIKRYLPHSRREPTRSILDELQEMSPQQALLPADMLEELMQMNVLNSEQLTEAIRLKVLADLDVYHSLGAGTASFVSEPLLDETLPAPDLTLEQMFQQAHQRQKQWEQVKKLVPSMDMVPTVDSEALERSSLPEAHSQWLRKVVQPDLNLADISVLLAQDTLEIATRFASFKHAGIIRLESTAHAESDTVMIIDDSPVVLMQFQHLVSTLGYPVVVNQEADQAIAMIHRIKPAIIFIDINMPGISGFELVSQIRQTPEIAETPLVILTGDQKLSNKWRAQWSGCDFLTKPLSVTEIDHFQGDLQAKLQAVIPRT
ncbi:MAG: response regulator [Cyanobacteria bacterium P01_F01_bin.42]